MADTALAEAFRTILSVVERIAGLTQEIEAATTEQAVGAEQIVQATQDLSRVTQEISAATTEQSLGAAEVVRAMEQLREITQQAAEMANNLQSSAQELQHQSGLLNGVVSQFQTDDTELAASAPTPKSGRVNGRAPRQQRQLWPSTPGVRLQEMVH
jgi:methyl-accepting chemotaxis protein